MAKNFLGFVSYIPISEDRLYLALTRPSRYGQSTAIGDTVLHEERDQRAEFFERMEGVFEGEAVTDDILVTIF